MRNRAVSTRDRAEETCWKAPTFRAIAEEMTKRGYSMNESTCRETCYMAIRKMRERLSVFPEIRAMVEDMA